ncbi:hypothetical protein ACHHYP_11220 [Achlya hypogyna]|uniref:Uncharacterized protein n=1 Tax=Achlya hypogyna TaxID=1202772 RepID=A0A1V9YJK0_ACHHY|nr:hypothetical protein ACHHYP_11220 [Achlya hypogyna]
MMDAMTTASKLESDVQSMVSTGRTLTTYAASEFAAQKAMSVQYTVLQSSAGLYVRSLSCTSASIPMRSRVHVHTEIKCKCHADT